MVHKGFPILLQAHEFDGASFANCLLLLLLRTPSSLNSPLTPQLERVCIVDVLLTPQLDGASFAEKLLTRLLHNVATPRHLHFPTVARLFVCRFAYSSEGISSILSWQGWASRLCLRVLEERA